VKRVDVPPLHDWRRSYPTAKRVAAAIPPDMLRLRTRIIVSDVRARFRCATATAMKAVSLARYPQ
jgi:hypothetical protein